MTATAATIMAKPATWFPADGLLQVEHRENRKHQQSDHLLNGLELGRAELVGADPIGRHLKAILKESDHPADYDHLK